MNGWRVIYRRELAAAYDSPIAYIFSIVFLLLTSGVFMNEFFLTGLIQMDSYFEFLPYVLVVFAPTLSMRLWAEDRKFNTYELLMTLPVQPLAIVVAKFLAALTVYGLVLVGSLPIVVMLYALGSPDGGRLAASYLGALFLGGFLLAIGQFLSLLSKDQIVAYLTTLLAGSSALLSGHELLAGVMDGLSPRVQAGTWLRETVSALPHYEAFTRGLVELRSTVYFGLLAVVFLYMSLRVIEAHKE